MEAEALTQFARSRRDRGIEPGTGCLWVSGLLINRQVTWLSPFSTQARRWTIARMRSRPEPALTGPVAQLELAPAWQQHAECVNHAGEVDFFPAAWRVRARREGGVRGVSRTERVSRVRAADESRARCVGRAERTGAALTAARSSPRGVRSSPFALNCRLRTAGDAAAPAENDHVDRERDADRDRDRERAAGHDDCGEDDPRARAPARSGGSAAGGAAPRARARGDEPFAGAVAVCASTSPWSSRRRPSRSCARGRTPDGDLCG